MVDVNGLVQAVLRDAYMEHTKDLHINAAEIKYFNEMKTLVTDPTREPMPVDLEESVDEDDWDAPEGRLYKADMYDEEEG